MKIRSEIYKLFYYEVLYIIYKQSKMSNYKEDMQKVELKRKKLRQEGL